MRTEKQIEASRLNGAKSRGPVTPEGKQASSQNAVKHGFLAGNVLIKGEDEPAFLALCSQLHDEFQPSTPFEESLVQTMAVASWRRERIWNVERVSLDLEMAKEDQRRAPDELASLAFTKLANESGTLDLIHRYETRYERQYFRAHKRLLEVQATRRQHDGPDHPAPAAPSPKVIPIDSRTTDDPKSPAPAVEDTAAEDVASEDATPDVPAAGGADGLAVCVTNKSAKRTQAETTDPRASVSARGHALSSNGDKFPGVEPNNPKAQQS